MEPKAGYKTSEIYVTGAAGTVLGVALGDALAAGQQWAAIGCALALALVTHGYGMSRGKAKGGAA